MLTTSQAAELLQVHPRTLRRWVRLGLVPGVRLGRGFRFEEDDLRLPDLRPAPPALGSYPERTDD